MDCPQIMPTDLRGMALRGNFKNRIQAPGYFDDIKYRKAWSRCQWNGAAQDKLTQQKEVNAYILQRDQDLSLIRMPLHKQTGRIGSLMRALKTENKLYQDTGMPERINNYADQPTN